MYFKYEEIYEEEEKINELENLNEKLHILKTLF